MSSFLRFFYGLTAKPLVAWLGWGLLLREEAERTVVEWQTREPVYLVAGVEHAENIVLRHIEKDSSKQIRFLYLHNFVGRCNFIINLYKQQQNIDSISSKALFNHFSPGFAYDIVFADAVFEHVLLMSACVFTSQVSYNYSVCCRSIGWFYYAAELWIKCWLFVVSFSGRRVIMKG